MAAKPKKREIAPFSLNMRSHVKEAPPYRPGINLGCLFDIPTGRFVRGYDGHWYHTGGLNPTTGIGGRGNMFKSTLAHFMLLTLLDRFVPYANAHSRDTEFTQTAQRFQELGVHMPNVSAMNLATSDHFVITSQGEDSGNSWFSTIQDYFEAKRKAPAKQVMFTTPFLDQYGAIMKTFLPTGLEIDSLSQFSTDVTDRILEENQIGEGASQTVGLRGAGAKWLMMTQIPTMANQSGAYVIMTAHMDEEIKMDAHAPDSRKLTFMKMNLKFKNVPNNFHTLTNNLWMVMKCVTEQDDKKRPYFPRDEKDTMEGDTDLMRMTLWNLRAKQGPSGMPFDLILSQSEGVLVSVTEYLYLKAHGNYGVTAAGNTFELDLYPGVIFDRKTLRSLTDNDPKMARAMTISSELCQIKFMEPDYRSILLSPKALRKALEDKGFSWEKLLDTRGFWVFKEMEKDSKPFLSTLDLLYMAAGEEEQPWYAQFKK